MPRRRWSALAIWAAMTMCVLDTSLVNVALPTIAKDLGASPSASVWVVNAYQIAIVMTLLGAASLGEIIGYRRIYLIGLAAFVGASALCMMAQSIEMLTIARFLQGLGAAPIMAANGALVRFTYPKAALGRGVSYNALVVALSAAAGPSVGALLLALGPWPLLFMVNIPIGLLALLMGSRVLPPNAGIPHRFDWRTAIYNALGFGGLFFGAGDLTQHGVNVGGTITLLISGAAFITIIRKSRSETRPLIPIDLLRLAPLRLSYAASMFAFSAQTMTLIALPFYAHYRFGLSATHTGLIITAWPLAMMIFAPISGRLTERVAPGLLGGVGLGIVALGLVTIAVVPDRFAELGIIAGMVLGGAGFATFQTPNNQLMLGLAPIERSGAAAGMLAAARMVGTTTGALIVTFLFSLFSTTTRVTFLVAAAIVLCAAYFSLKRLHSGAAAQLG